MNGINMIGACIITVAVEYAVFFFFGYMKKKDFGILCVAANVATNLSLNLILISCTYTPKVLIPGELVVFAAEYALYAVFVGRSKRLFAVTFLANGITFAIGATAAFLFGTIL